MNSLTLQESEQLKIHHDELVNTLQNLSIQDLEIPKQIKLKFEKEKQQLLNFLNKKPSNVHNNINDTNFFSPFKKFIQTLNALINDRAMRNASEDIQAEANNSRINIFKKEAKKFILQAAAYLGIASIAVSATIFPVAIAAAILLFTKGIYDVIEKIKEKKYEKLIEESVDLKNLKELTTNTGETALQEKTKNTMEQQDSLTLLKESLKKSTQAIINVLDKNELELKQGFIEDPAIENLRNLNNHLKLSKNSDLKKDDDTNKTLSFLAQAIKSVNELLEEHALEKASKKIVDSTNNKIDIAITKIKSFLMHATMYAALVAASILTASIPVIVCSAFLMFTKILVDSLLKNKENKFLKMFETDKVNKQDYLGDEARQQKSNYVRQNIIKSKLLELKNASSDKQDNSSAIKNDEPKKSAPKI